MIFEMNREMRKTVKLDSRERSSEFRKLYEITGVVGVGGGGTVYAGMLFSNTFERKGCLYAIKFMARIVHIKQPF